MRAGERFALVGVWLAVLCAVAPAGAWAQGAGAPPSPRPRHVTVSGGVAWTGGYSIGSATAELRGNAVGATAPRFVLFDSESSMEFAAGMDARIGYTITPALTIELGFSYQRPRLTTALSQDAEAPAVTLDAEHLSQYVIDAAALWQVPGITIGGRLRPFVMVGGGYLRQLYDQRTLAETGGIYYAGGGVRYWLRGADGEGRAVGLRADGRAMWRVEGVEFEGQTRVMPAATLHMFLEF